MSNLKINEEQKKRDEGYYGLFRNVAFISAIFSLIVSFIIIVNFIQFKKNDPINSPQLAMLIERIHNKGGDAGLSDTVREYDLLIRKAYFTSVSFHKFGIYLLIGGLGVFLFSMKMMGEFKRSLPAPPKYKEIEDDKPFKRKLQYLLIVLAIALVIASIVISKIKFLEFKNLTKEAPITVPAMTQNKEIIPEGDLSKQIQDSIQTTDLSQKIESKETPEEVKKYATNDALSLNWPSFRGYRSIGVTKRDDLPTKWNNESGENIRWKIKLPKPGFNSPVVWENKIFLSGGDASSREIYCLNAETGEMLWTQNTSNSENVVIPETTEDTGLAASTMATNGIAVAAIFATGELIGLSPEGKVLWQNKLETPSNHYGHSSSLITCKDILFVQYDHNEGASIKAFNILTGKMLWENKREVETCWSSPILVSTDSGEQLILTAVPLIIGYEAETGKILWQMKDTLTGEIGSSAAYIEGLLYVANQFATAACIDVKQQKILWQYDDNLPDASSPVVQNNFLILPSGTGKVTCLNSANGEMFWEHKFENGFYSSPIVVTDKVYLMDKKGNMQIFKLGREFELIAESKINEACVTTPAFAGNKIFIRGNENLFCIENKSK